MKKAAVFLLLSSLVLLTQSCETNPPNAPVFIGSGHIQLKIKVEQAPKISVANKVVMLEDFANVSCIPCVASNKVIEAVANSYGPSKLAVVKFPTNFPSPNDPFYLANKEVCDYKMSSGFYNIIVAPTTIVDGNSRLYSISDSTDLKNVVDQKLTQSPRFSLSIVDSMNNGSYFISLTIGVIDTSGISTNDLVLFSAVTETDIEFSSPPGSNGETKFYDVLRFLMPDKFGKSLSSIIAAGEETVLYEDAFGSEWNPEKIHTVCYIQNPNTKEIYQAAKNY
jgi:hypothetical protein